MDKRYQHLNGEERGVILAEHRRGASLQAIGLLLGRSASTIGRELRRGRPVGQPAQPYCPQFGAAAYRARRKRCGQRSLRGTALGRKARLFAGSDRGGNRTAFMYSLIVTAKMNDIDPQAWLADVLATMPAMAHSRLPDLLPWNWRAASSQQKAA